MNTETPPETPPVGGVTVTPVPVPVIPATFASLPQKRVLEDGHSPAVSSPLNPDPNSRRSQAPEETGVMVREKRVKKETLKKRESKATTTTPGGAVESARATPDPRQTKKSLKNVPPAEMAPARYILPLPKFTDFEPARGPMLVNHHEVSGPGGERIEFLETQEQSVPDHHDRRCCVNALTPVQCLQQEAVLLHPLHSRPQVPFVLVLPSDRAQAVWPTHEL